MSLAEEEKDILESMHFKWGPKGRTPLNVRINVINQNKSSLTPLHMPLKCRYCSRTGFLLEVKVEKERNKNDISYSKVKRHVLSL